MKVKLLFTVNFALLFGLAFSQTYSSWRVQLLANLKPDYYFSGCWGWYDPVKNKEYAISGAAKGTFFVDITNPISSYIADSLIGIPISIWREIKTYKNYCYIISDDYGPSFQIVDLSPLPDSIRVVASPDTGILYKGHALWIDKHYLYVGIPVDKYSGTHSMGLFDLLPDPENPQFLRYLDEDYPSINQVHDMYVRNDTIFASAGYQGLQVYKYDSIQNKFIYLNSLVSYLEAGYNHSSALTQNGKTLVFMDEVPKGLSIKITDVSNLNNMQVVNYLKPYNYSNFVAHNPFVLGNQYLVASCYQDGTLIYDISNPANPVMTGYFDTYPQGGANTGTYTPGYASNWGSYPFFPSGLIFSNDGTNGIFILKADSALSVRDIDKSQPSIVFPNPAKDKIYIYTNIKNQLHISIVDISGKKILDVHYLHSNSLEPLMIKLPEVSDGIYFLTILAEDNSYVCKKIIIQN